MRSTSIKWILEHGAGTGADIGALSVTYYFNRYDFAASAGANVTTASVSTPTGYDGDTVTFTCSLPFGAQFLGWYSGGTCISTEQTFTHTVTGADLSVEARASAPVVTTKERYLLFGSEIKYHDAISGSLAVGYGDNLFTLSDGSRTLNCRNRVMTHDLTFNEKGMSCSGKLMPHGVVVMLCNGTWEDGKGLQSGTGTLADAAGFITTPFLLMEGGRISVTVSTGGTRSGSMLNEYGSDLGYLSYWGQASATRTFTLDSNSTQYLRATFLRSALADCYIYDNTNGKYIFKGSDV